MTAEHQRARRQWLKKKGYRRIELELSPELLDRLMPYIEEYGGKSHPGHAITRLLQESVNPPEHNTGI